jgi:hypothetical protein
MMKRIVFRLWAVVICVVLILWLVIIAAVLCTLIGCRTSEAARTARRALPTPLPVEMPRKTNASVQVSVAAGDDSIATSLVATHWRVEWDYHGPGPLWFEVWHRTNDLNGFSFTGGTNVPAGFTLFATTPKTNGVTFSVPIAADQAAEFFIVRGVNEFGPGPWAQ